MLHVDTFDANYHHGDVEGHICEKVTIAAQKVNKLYVLLCLETSTDDECGWLLMPSISVGDTNIYH